MDTELNADQQLLADTVRRFLADRAPLPWVRATVDDPSAATRDVWDGLAGLGVGGLLAPTDCDGSGMGMVDVAVVLEELGRALYPGPYASSAVGAVSLVLRLGTPGDHERLLPQLARGERVGTVALYEAGRRADWTTPATKAAARGGSWRVTGTKVHVPDASVADLLLVTAATDDGLAVLGVEPPAPGVAVEPFVTVDGTRRHGTVVLDGAPAFRLGSGDAGAAVRETVDRIGLARVVDGVGAAARALELTVAYAKEREQFDRPIGSFQAVQHLCADMLRAVELARAGAYYACWAIDAADAVEAHRAVTLARAFAADELYRVGASAIQVFAGIGYTWEHDIHLFYKRLLTLQQEGGGASDHLEELARIVLDES